MEERGDSVDEKWKREEMGESEGIILRKGGMVWVSNGEQWSTEMRVKQWNAVGRRSVAPCFFSPPSALHHFVFVFVFDYICICNTICIYLCLHLYFCISICICI